MKQLKLLLVEDNVADVVFFREALLAAGVALEMQVVENGEEAMRFLRRQGQFTGAPRPNVVVLDLNLPVMKGREVLREMAADAALNTIPVAVLTTSTSEMHVCDAYPGGRCLYLVKTDEFKQLQELVRKIAAHAQPAA
jgi:CheY-like chemotaxis protein